MTQTRAEIKTLLKGLAFLSPWLLGFFFFTAIPVALSLYYSFCDYSLLQPPVFLGAENYVSLLNDGPVFWKALRVTAVFAVVSLPLGLIVALLLALLLNAKVKGLVIYRTIIYLPSLVPAVASSMLWMWLFNARLGLINTFLRSVGIDDPPGWLADTRWALPALILMSVWGVGNTVIIYLAGLQDVPRELYEAAELDGAGTVGKIFHVTLPAISPVIFFNLIMALIGSLQVFSTAFIMTGGGPARATYFYTLALYEKAFQNLKMGEASAMAWIQLLIILALTGFAFWSSKRWVHYQGK